ncbi:hypothetical protein [Hyphomicrobium sp.]|uniref:hypothetical protein n=1 Tax=Hyphomicrobium sp. TaxID=82 RepID=UPI000F949A64|nr:hypothetical protein [Hyphomicrobium sp.]MBN9248136.1 hypothetical protein [Hyphomicrobium sp.]RUP09901.1 MAG: hypothetical protein EKK38_05495 [Hyphomicrobium sp.]
MAAQQDVSSTVRAATSAAKQNIDQTADYAVSVIDDVQSVGTEFKRAVNKSMKKEPYTTLALAAAAGFILGALWRA